MKKLLFLLLITYNLNAQHYRTDVHRLDSMYVYSTVIGGTTHCSQQRVIWALTGDSVGFWFNNRSYLFRQVRNGITYRGNSYKTFIEKYSKDVYFINFLYDKDFKNLSIFITNIEYGTPSYVLSTWNICVANKKHEKTLIKYQERNRLIRLYKIEGHEWKRSKEKMLKEQPKAN